MILLIDNYDSFTYNLYQYMGIFEKDIKVVRNDKITIEEIEQLNPNRIVLSPGPKSPKEAGICMDVVKHFYTKKPILGICLGLQLMFESSEESPGVEGLGLLPGKILKIPETPGMKVPHMGWNSLKIDPNSRLFKGIPDGSYVYFVHSYYLKAGSEDIVAATTEYGTHIHAAVEKGNLYACQFHPEKSSQTGLKILENFISLP